MHKRKEESRRGSDREPDNTTHWKSMEGKVWRNHVSQMWNTIVEPKKMKTQFRPLNWVIKYNNNIHFIVKRLSVLKTVSLRTTSQEAMAEVSEHRVMGIRWKLCSQMHDIAEFGQQTFRKNLLLWGWVVKKQRYMKFSSCPQGDYSLLNLLGAGLVEARLLSGDLFCVSF